jgi:hypothetical protein
VCNRVAHSLPSSLRFTFAYPTVICCVGQDSFLPSAPAIAFLEGGAGEDAQLLDKALEDRQVVMVPVVLTKLLSDR